MAEPYVPIADYTAALAVLTSIEITTDAIATNATALATAQTSALSSNTSAQNLLDRKFNYFFLVGG